MSNSTLILIAYVGTGITVYVALYRLFRKAGFSIFDLIEPWIVPRSLFLILWPIASLLSLLQYWHLIYLRKRKKEREILANSRERFSRMTLDELLAEQRKVLKSFDPPKN